MSEIIYKGLRLKSDKCKYIEVKEGSSINLVEDVQGSCLRLTFTPGSSAKVVAKQLGIPLVGSGSEILTGTGQPKRITHTTISLNGLVLEKQTYDSHTINMIIVGDSESRVVQTYYYTIFVVSENDYRNPEFIQFLFYSGNLLYLKPIGKKVGKDYEICNFPKLIIGDKNVGVTSESQTIFSLRRRYNDYVIREIDYQDQFLLEVRRVLEDYGIELVRINKERTLEKTSYVTYQFNQSPINDNHPFRDDHARNIISRKQSIEFVLHTPDMVLYHDFKSKYANVNLLSNLTEFRTTDKYGDRWTAAAKWSPITEDFNQLYQLDDNNNFAFQCQFRAELHFYEMLDTRYEFLETINSILSASDVDGSNPIEESNKTITRDDNV